MASTGQVVYAHAAIQAAKNGDREIVAALANHRIQVHAFVLTNDGATGDTNVRFESAATGTALTGVMTVTDEGALVVPFSEVPYFITDAHVLATDDNLSLEVENISDIAGFIVYSYVRVRD